MNIKAFLLLSLVFLYLPISSQTTVNISGNATQTLSAPGSYNIVIPTGFTATLDIQVIGGGGGVQGGTGSRDGGGGGGYAKRTITNVPAGTYSASVGAGGSGQVNGGASTITINSFTLNADGGTASNSGIPGVGGGATGGTINTSGGNGGNNSGNTGGGGGGAGGETGNGLNGGDGDGTNGGTAGAGNAPGGNGGAGGANGSNGNPGISPGGGAGGRGLVTTAQQQKAGDGRIIIIVTDYMAVSSCPSFTGLTPNNVTITNSTCTLPTCIPTGGVINAATNNCPTGSTLQYRVTIGGTPGAWSTTIPVYDQDGPAQTIETRCNCNNDNTLNSSLSSPAITIPGVCPTACFSGTLSTPTTFVGGPTSTFTISTGITGTWSVNGGGTIDPATGIFTPSAPGCFTATFTPTSGSPIVQDFAVFPAAPAALVVTNTCNSAIVVPALPVVAGFKAQYSFNGVWGTSNSSPTTPGCYIIQTCYIINTTCGTVLAGTQGPFSPLSAGVIFPAAPAAPVVANTCNSAIVVPVLPAVAGFTAQYSFNGVWGTSSSSPTTPGCYTIQTRYVTSAACGNTPANTVAPGACAESANSNAVIFPAPPAAPVVANTCNAAIVVPALPTVTGFTAQYSFNGVWGAFNSSPITPGCYDIQTRYVTSAACGSITGSTVAPIACAASPVANAVIFPQAPTLAAITPRCNTNITIPAITNTPGFTRQYSFDNGMTWSTSNISTFSTPGCYSVKARYV
jgi:hypothetical protein